MKKKILILGSEGQIGLHLKSYLKNKNYNVMSFDIVEKNNQAALQNMLEKYVDNIHLYNQKGIFNFIETEFSLEEKMKELNEAYDFLINLDIN